MAENDLGTLRYDMIVSDEKLKKSLDSITAQIQEKEKIWNQAFKNVGVGGTLDISKITQSAQKITQIEAAENGKQAQSWKQFVKERMADYMRLEGGHAGAMKRMSAEWNAYKNSLSVGKVGSLDISSIRSATQEIVNGNENVISANKSVISSNNAIGASTKKRTESTAAMLRIERLKIAVEEQEAGSIGRLRAENQLWLAQIAKLNPFIAAERAEIIKLTQARNANSSRIQDLQPTLGLWGKLISAIRTYATAYLSVQAVMGLGKAIYNQTKELDQLAFGMKTVIKSSVELANTQKFLSEVAVNYGGDLLTLSERYIKFRAAAQQSNMSAAETQKIFDSMSKAAGTLGLKTDELSGVYLALEQMISKGKVTTEELRRQLGERLPGAFGIMANALGVTIPQLDKMLKKGEVLSKDALPKFADAIEKAYGIESLKKIDTLAAAQGRMSTEFTGLIQAMDKSDAFKGAINGIADFLGFIKNNMSLFGAMAKGILLVVAALTTQKLIMAASNVIQRVSIALTGSQVVAMKQLSGAQLASAEATWVNVRSWNALSTTFKTFGGWISILVNLLITAASAFFIFRSKAKETADAMGDLNKEEDALTRNLNYQKKVIKEAETGTNRYANAIKEINVVALKYNQALLTQADSQDKINASINETIRLIKEEYLEKRKAKLLEQAETDRTVPLDKFREELYSMFDPSEAYDKFIQFQEMVAKGASNTDILKAARGNKKITNDKVFLDAIEAEREYLKKKAEIEAKYITKVKPDILGFDVELLKKNIDDAKGEFDRLEEVTKVGGKLATPDFSLDFKSNKDYLKSLLVEYAKFPEALELINLELAKLEKDKKGGKQAEDIQSNRNEALKKLNERYLADLEEFANFEAGISAGRIAEMEDSIDKEKKLNELAYANRIKAIEKEKIATLALLNDARDPKSPVITSFSATGYDPATQSAINDAGSAYTQDQLNAAQVFREANLKSEKDYAYKLKEIRRDMNDQFLTGMEKERAAIKEKYDDWEKKAIDAKDWDLVSDIFKARNTANDELYRQNELDQLDFKREIEYKKNEIANKGAINQRKLDKANFDTYVKYERERIKILKSSVSVDKQKEGLTDEQLLKLDEELFKEKQKQELKAQIVEGAKEFTSELIKHVNLSGELERGMGVVVDSFGKMSSGDYISGALSFLGAFSEVFTGKEDDPNYLERQMESAQKLYSIMSKLLETLDGDDFMAQASTNLEQFNIDLDKSWKGLDAYRKTWKLTERDVNGRQIRIDASGFTEVTQWVDLLNTLKNDKFGNWADNPSFKAVQTYVDSILDTTEQITQLQEKVYQKQLGFSSSDISNSIFEGIDAGLELGKDSLGGFADSFGNFVKTALMTAIREATDKRINTEFMSKYSEFMQNDNLLDDAELKTLEDIYIGIAKDSERDAANVKKITDKYITDKEDENASSSSQSIPKSIQELTEDTGRRLEGLINAIRETGVINMGNVAKLVESAQMTNSYASQSLGVLRNIDTTTAAQLTLFNSLVKAGHPQGGVGLKVFA
jgi:tape measure domain-containing protein